MPVLENRPVHLELPPMDAPEFGGSFSQEKSSKESDA